MLNFTKLLGFDSGIDLADFRHNKGTDVEEEEVKQLWYNQLIVMFYEYFFKFLKYAW